MSRLATVEIDETGLPVPPPELEQERRVALFDLTEANSFALPPPAPDGPYGLRLSQRGGSLSFELACPKGQPAASFALALGSFRQILKDYFQICESYRDAVRRLPPAEIETIDTARRAIHDAGSELLQARLAGKARIDMATARRLFTLICALHPGGV
ncbi:MAG: UPF0262 family protein [Pseudomonadota bacterium]